MYTEAASESDLDRRAFRPGENDAVRRFARRHSYHGLLWSETAEQTILFPVCSTAIAAVAELDAPESVDDNCLTMRVMNLVDQFGRVKLAMLGEALRHNLRRKIN
jgi:hypothetical protein